MSLNKVQLIGRLGADPETRSVQGSDITTIRLATTRRWKDRNTNERKEETEWHRVVFFGSLATVASNYLKKGSQAYVEGRIRTQKWQGQDGSDRFTTEIVAESLVMLDGKPAGSGSGDPGAYRGTSGAGGTGGHAGRGNDGRTVHQYDDFDDEIPF